MIRRTHTALNGETVVGLLPENEADERELDRLEQQGLLDTRLSFGDDDPKAAEPAPQDGETHT